VSSVLEETGERFPLYCDANGVSEARWETTTDGNWCAGYWIGLLWIAARHSHPGRERERFLAAAYAHLPALLAQPAGHIFAGLNHYYAGFLGYDITGDEDLQRIGLRGADMMLELYNAAARQIPIGTYATAPEHTQRTSRTPLDRSDFAAVDVIHTSIPVLLRACAETGRKEYRDVAMAHARRHLEWHIREDGSTSQLTTFDRRSGTRRETFNTLAAGDSGCWSRGLGWNIAGLAKVFTETGDTEILAALKRSARYYEVRSGSDLVPAWDLSLTDPSAERDSSAAAVTCYGLLQLTPPGAAIGDLIVLGKRILDGLLRTCLVGDADAPNAGAILHGCYRRPKQIAVDAELIWSDFYTAAALSQIVSPGRGFAAD
jgi:unsaturated chondroitin disaccharide hydrolase